MHIELPWLVALVFGLLLLGSIVLRAARGWVRRRGLRAQVLDAQKSERRAARLLQRRGYQIEALQPSQSWTLWANGEPLEVLLRADLLVRKGGRRFVADVKLGERAARITTVATRRQLLEYRIAYGVDGVLLIDMAREAIVEVEFALDG